MPAICATYTDGFLKMQASSRQHSNFGFLADHDPVFLQLAFTVEAVFTDENSAAALLDRIKSEREKLTPKKKTWGK